MRARDAAPADAKGSPSKIGFSLCPTCSPIVPMTACTSDSYPGSSGDGASGPNPVIEQQTTDRDSPWTVS